MSQTRQRKNKIGLKKKDIKYKINKKLNLKFLTNDFS